MEQNNINAFFAIATDKLPVEKLPVLREQIEKLPDDRLTILQGTPFKNPTTMIIIAFFLGGFGVDRFMLGNTGLGILKLLTCGGAGIWAIIDLFTASKRAKDWNYKKVMEML